MLFFITPACSSNPADAPVEVKAWNDINPQRLNTKIKQAYQSGQSWVNKPRLYIFNLFYFDELKGFSYDYSVDNTENPQNIIIRVERDGFLDDSLRGDLQHLELQKNKEGEWSILSLKKAHRCWRSEVRTFTTEACP